MTEKLVSHDQRLDATTIKEIESVLAKVATEKVRPDPIVMPPVYAENGRVLRPAIDVVNGTISDTTRPLEEFYERTHKGVNKPESYFDDYELTRAEKALMEARQEARQLGLIE